MRGFSFKCEPDCGHPTFTDQIVVCENDAAELIGFAELRVRNYAEGSENMAVPYLEGWYVEPAYRQRGIGRLLIAAAEEWARSSGHDELASDAEIDNHNSIAAHLASGFQEVERSVSFLKKL
ncbi:MAG: GNAT family N-acetyltransferase [Gammaproteobacteria bacterium]|nr:GNAT family N-acetyltransferase [Gammaproteobacteria bacterium]